MNYSHSLGFDGSGMWKCVLTFDMSQGLLFMDVNSHFCYIKVFSALEYELVNYSIWWFATRIDGFKWKVISSIESNSRNY